MKKSIKVKYISTILVILFTILFSYINTVLATDVSQDSESSNRTYVVTQQNVSISTRTSYDAKATIMVPNGTTEAMPLVVMCHGYTGNRNGDGDRFISLGGILAKNGIAAITIDFPGCGESPAPASDYTLTNMYEYINSAIDYMDREYDIDTDRLGILGHSMGGRVASLYTQTGNYSIEALALWAPANGDGANGKEFLNRGSFSFGYSQEFINQMDSSHPNSAVSSFGGPKLLAIDSDDENGDGPLSPETMEQSKAAAGSGATILEYTDNHNFDNHGGDLVNKTANFFGKAFLGRDLVADGSEFEEQPIYTIEDIIFNRIPLLDINFFSDTAAGQPIREGSVVSIIRNVVSTWYVAFRNLVITILSILIVYTGIRIAISTIPQQKATYKTMLMGWFKALLIVLLVHIIMILIVNTNNGIVNLVEEACENKLAADGWAEESIYDTIKTRAYDFRLSVGLPATFMYVFLIVIWLRFLWVYIKRSFTILILVMIAPFIGGKYALDSAKGKKSSSFGSWLYDFTINVLIQTVHALVYTMLMTSAISFAFESVVGYIVALIIMNFMLSADEIFRDVFNFDGRSSLAKQAAKQEGFKEIMNNFAGAMFVGQMFKGSLGLIKGTGKFVGNVSQAGYRALTKINPSVKDTVDRGLDSIDRAIEKAVPASNVKGTPKNAADIGGSIANMIHYNAKIRRLSRQKGTIGMKARTLKRQMASHVKKRYTANFKDIKNKAIGVGSLLLGIPMTILNPTAAMALVSKGIVTFKKPKDKKRYKKYKTDSKGRTVEQSEAEYKQNKYTKKRDKNYKNVDLLESIINKQDDIQNKMDELRRNGVDERDINVFKNSANIFLVEASTSKINEIISEYLKVNRITFIDNNVLEDLVDEIADKLGIKLNLDDRTKSLISYKARMKAVAFNSQNENQQENRYTGTEEQNGAGEGPANRQEGPGSAGDGNRFSGNNQEEDRGPEPSSQGRQDNSNRYTGSNDTDNSGRNRGPEDRSNNTGASNNNRNGNDETRQTNHTGYKAEDIARAIQESFVEEAVDDRFKDTTKELFNLEKQIKKYEKSAKTKLRGANKFIQGL